MEKNLKNNHPIQLFLDAVKLAKESGQRFVIHYKICKGTFKYAGLWIEPLDNDSWYAAQVLFTNWWVRLTYNFNL